MGLLRCTRRVQLRAGGRRAAELNIALPRRRRRLCCCTAPLAPWSSPTSPSTSSGAAVSARMLERRLTGCCCGGLLGEVSFEGLAACSTYRMQPGALSSLQRRRCRAARRAGCCATPTCAWWGATAAAAPPPPWAGCSKTRVSGGPRQRVFPWLASRAGYRTAAAGSPSLGGGLAASLPSACAQLSPPPRPGRLPQMPWRQWRRTC